MGSTCRSMPEMIEFLKTLLEGVVFVGALLVLSVLIMLLGSF